MYSIIFAASKTYNSIVQILLSMQLTPYILQLTCGRLLSIPTVMLLILFAMRFHLLYRYGKHYRRTAEFYIRKLVKILRNTSFTSIYTNSTSTCCKTVLPSFSTYPRFYTDLT